MHLGFSPLYVEYKPILQDSLETASKRCLAASIGHEPQQFDRCFKMQQNLAVNGTMKIKSWDMKIDLCEQVTDWLDVKRPAGNSLAGRLIC